MSLKFSRCSDRYFTPGRNSHLVIQVSVNRRIVRNYKLAMSDFNSWLNDIQIEIIASSKTQQIASTGSISASKATDHVCIQS